MDYIQGCLTHKGYLSRGLFKLVASIGTINVNSAYYYRMFNTFNNREFNDKTRPFSGKDSHYTNFLSGIPGSEVEYAIADFSGNFEVDYNKFKLLEELMHLSRRAREFDS